MKAQICYASAMGALEDELEQYGRLFNELEDILYIDFLIDFWYYIYDGAQNESTLRG